MRLTSSDKSNLARFGCVLLPEKKLICIDWEKGRKDQVLSAELTVRFVYFQSVSGPVLSLAFEVSPTKARPHYYFFPFNLRDKKHRKFFQDVFKSRKILLSFLVDSRQIPRTHEVLPRRCKSLSELYARVLADFEEFPADQYDFEHAVNEFEQKIRIVDYFLYCVAESDLELLIASSRAKAESVSLQERAQAAKLANDFLGSFRSRYDLLFRTQIQQIPIYSRALLLLADLQQHFEGNYDGAVQFAADLVATHAPKEDNRQLEAFTQLLELIFRMLDQPRERSIETEKAATANKQAAFQEIMNRVATQGISLGALQSILSIFGIQLGARPGRPPKDYSTEYELKAAGKKWREVAEHTLENDPGTHDEFGGRKYDELTFEEKERIRRRVKEGVRSYAKRKGKHFPPQKDVKSLPPPPGVQKNPG